MYISKKTRAQVYAKYNGLCAYSGTPLKDDWQVDHVKPLVRNWWDSTACFPDAHSIENMVPCQRVINHYKGSLDLHTFRTWLLGGLHERLKKLPKNTTVEKTKKRKAYLLEVAAYFGIDQSTPFSGKFYFEQIAEQ